MRKSKKCAGSLWCVINFVQFVIGLAFVIAGALQLTGGGECHPEGLPELVVAVGAVTILAVFPLFFFLMMGAFVALSYLIFTEPPFNYYSSLEDGADDCETLRMLTFIGMLILWDIFALTLFSVITASGYGHRKLGSYTSVCGIFDNYKQSKRAGRSQKCRISYKSSMLDGHQYNKKEEESEVEQITRRTATEENSAREKCSTAAPCPVSPAAATQSKALSVDQQEQVPVQMKPLVTTTNVAGPKPDGGCTLTTMSQSHMSRQEEKSIPPYLFMTSGKPEASPQRIMLQNCPGSSSNSSLQPATHMHGCLAHQILMPAQPHHHYHHNPAPIKQ